ncbi:2-succinyl-5-enolpyruvyl-6-hydroxy-3-cyclohexene-1-carboxylate synthase, partial [Proteus mirabilis]|nr:2-succinyl-5-enolpyruvyl-6-hydroxy-3-cyclohexene-1-carboxylate synthase [Proteus mirabilis]
SLTGKRYLQSQANTSPQIYWVIVAIPGRLDPGHHQGEKFTLSPSQRLTAHPAIDNLTWALSISHIATQTNQNVTEVTD